VKGEWHVNDAKNQKMVYVPKDSVMAFMISVSKKKLKVG
jgi:hypothetical protein